MKILLTGFDPFGKDVVNPAWEAVNKTSNQIGNVEIVKLKVPTVFYKSINTVIAAIEKEKPDTILCIGQAGGRCDLSLERVAINVNDARICDNEGNQPIDEPIYKDGESAYFSSLPIKAMVKMMKEEGIPASISNTAGTYVCNHLMYGVLYYLEKKHLEMKAGFMHVPYMTSQVVSLSSSLASLPLETIVKGIEISISAIEKYEKDIRTVEGKLD